MSLGCAAAAAHAEQSWFQFEAGIGGTAYQDSGDTLWYQNRFEHKLDLTAPALEAGITGDIFQSGHWGLSYHVDWVWLATIHTQALATPSDANYNAHSTTGCNGKCWPLANYVGSGHDSGLMFTLEPHYDTGDWRFGVQAGPYLHKSTWSVDVFGWRPEMNAVPSNIHVESKPRWTLGAVIGASVEYRRFALQYLYFMNGVRGASDNPYPPIWRGTHVLMGRYRF